MPLVVPGITGSSAADNKTTEWANKLMGKTLGDGGSNETTFARKDLPAKTRVLKPGDVSTMDMQPDRLNVHLGDDGTVSPSQKRLALAIHDFLSSSLADGTLSGDDRESIEVAQSCIAESFGVDPTDEAAVKDALGGQNLLAIYGVYEKLKGKGSGGSGGAATGAAAAPTAAPTEAQKAEAETLKGQGNGAMAKKQYSAAVEAYTKALALAPNNPIYLSNRAAAYSASQQHALAKADAQAAVAADPKYTKAWSRLGLALFALGDAKASMDAYGKGIEHEGSGGSEAMKKGYETARRKVEEADAEQAPLAGTEAGAGAGGAGGMPDLAGLASMLGGGGGAGAPGGSGGGGMPDLGGLMSNPMFASMAQKLMSNPAMMQNLMSNPRVREMAEGFGGAGGAGAGGAGGGGGGGGGMPDLGSLMNDPSIAEM
ncbi:MAG: hypothetical protein M1832_000152 [Thelocarpon impressellum]|nr:MAG: hypothetical protein M1832_000152 [Thelocarpon impressellum]